MKNKKTNLSTTSTNGKQSKETSTRATTDSVQPMRLDEDEPEDLYWANI